MRQGITVEVNSADRARLQAIVADRNSRQKYVWRARIVLMTADGVGTNTIMRQTGKSKVTVWRWQERFMAQGVDGLLRDKTRPSRIPRLPATVHERTVALTLTDPPGEVTHWTAPMMAEQVGISVSSVKRISHTHGLQPHRVRQFKLSRDRQFVAKLRDIVGLYVDPPADAVVLSVDEKSQIQALDPHPARLANEEGPLRDNDPRLQAAWHHHFVCRAQRLGRQDHRSLHAAPPPSGVHSLPQCDRSRHPGRQDHPRRPRQLRDTQARQSSRLARPASSLCLPLHPDLGLLAQCGRELLRQIDQTPPQTRRLPLDRRSPGRHQPLPEGNQRSPQALRVDRRSR